MVLPSASQTIARLRRRWNARPPSLADEPLLDGAELRGLAAWTQTQPWFFLDFHPRASHPLIGETPSAQRGRGFEFEENRAFQQGDESRLLNWRLFARTGDLYTKVFTEERRPQVLVLADRRAGMRFGTRRQLKATLAARIGACFAYQAHRQALAIGGLILNQQPDWVAPGTGDAPRDALLRSLAAACPPLDFEQTQPSLEEGLRLLVHRLAPGCLIILISDFADLDPEAAMPILRQISDGNRVQAIQVLDPVERALPVNGDFLVEDRAASRPLRIDGQDTVQQNRYTEAFTRHQAALKVAFRACGIPLRSCLTTDDTGRCLGQPDVRAGTN